MSPFKPCLSSHRFSVHLSYLQIDGLVQEIRNSSALAMELRLYCTNPSKWLYSNIGHQESNPSNSHQGGHGPLTTHICTALISNGNHKIDKKISTFIEISRQFVPLCPTDIELASNGSYTGFIPITRKSLFEATVISEKWPNASVTVKSIQIFCRVCTHSTKFSRFLEHQRQPPCHIVWHQQYNI